MTGTQHQWDASRLSARIVLNAWRVAQISSMYLVNKNVPTAYMDEIFHVPQAMAYCNGHFSTYDPKLTTPPGLYIISTCLNLCRIPCDLPTLRITNLCIGIILLPSMTSRIFKQLHPEIDRTTAAWSSCISMMPILSFFSLLYYTDVASTYTVLASYSHMLDGRLWRSAAWGFVSLWFRQTNFVWIMAFAALALVSELQLADPGLADGNSIFLAGPVQTSKKLLHIVLSSIRSWSSTVHVALPFMPIGLFALVFLMWNGSIVLGDKDMHKAGIYPIQIFYLTSFSVAISAPLYLRKDTVESISRAFRHPICGLTVVVIAIMFAHQARFQHVFVLSDNRHFPFYINRRIIQNISSRLLWLPFASATGLFLMRIPEIQAVPFLILAGGSICTLVPTSLLEFRYYILPYLLWRLHQKPASINGRAGLEALSWLAIQLVTVYLFLYKDFTWTDLPDKQRFMW